MQVQTRIHTSHTKPTKPLLDGVVRGGFFAPNPPAAFVAKPLPPRVPFQAKRQLDAVLLKQQGRQSLVPRSWRLAWAFFWRRLQIWSRRALRRLGRWLPELNGIPPKKAFYASLIGGVSFGMVAMSLLQGFTEPQAAADSINSGTPVSITPESLNRELVGGHQTYDPDSDIFLQFFSEAEKEEYGGQIRELVTGYPIEDMLPYILDKDRIVAAFLVGIAKKESNWGKRIPVLDGQDCFNYWGYRGIRRMMGTGGHTCFNSRKDAVDTVANRLEKLIHSNKLDTPAKMIIWKCGYSCDGHSRESVRKWIADVDLYFRELQEDPGDEGLVMNPSSQP